MHLRGDGVPKDVSESQLCIVIAAMLERMDGRKLMAALHKDLSEEEARALKRQAQPMVRDIRARMRAATPPSRYDKMIDAGQTL